MDAIKEKAENLRNEIKEKTTGYILTAFGLVAGLAWNDAITSAIKLYFPGENNIWAKFIYAVIITIAVIIISNTLASVLKKKNNATD